LSAQLYGLAAGIVAALGAFEAVGAITPAVRARMPLLVRRGLSLAESLLRAGREGRDPGAAERRRLLIAGAAVALVVGGFVGGPLVGLAAAAAGPFLVGRALRARRERYRRGVARGAAQIATGIAAALGGGRSVREAIVESARGLEGPPAHELERVAAELAVGARTEDALEAMRGRIRSHEIDTIVAGVLLQRRAGGDLGRLLRDCARSFEDQNRLEGEVRAATAQARFTGLIVVLLPFGGAVLAELASPGYLGSLLDGFLTAWLVGLAVILQVFAAVAIRSLGRVHA
jgi:tight adherence protein B